MTNSPIRSFATVAEEHVKDLLLHDVREPERVAKFTPNFAIDQATEPFMAKIVVTDENFAYVIRGGRPIHGTLVPGGNKNAALPMLAATLLADGPVELANVPQIRDVMVMLELLASLGAAVEESAPLTWRVDSSSVTVFEAPAALAC